MSKSNLPNELGKALLFLIIGCLILAIIFHYINSEIEPKLITDKFVKDDTFFDNYFLKFEDGSFCEVNEEKYMAMKINETTKCAWRK